MAFNGKVHNAESREAMNPDAKSDMKGTTSSSLLDRLMIPLLEAATTSKIALILHGEESWRSRVLHFIHTKRVQYTLAGLLVLDVLILFVELAIEAFSPSCAYIEKNGISCCPANAYSNYAAESYSCHEGWPLLNYPTTCDPEKRHNIEVIEHVLFYCTVSILGIFLMELLTLILVLGPREFFGHIFYTMDFIVVSVSLTLELTFAMKGEAILEAVMGLLDFWSFLAVSANWSWHF